MAGPQFLTPKPTPSAHQKKRFTLQEANRALPLVRRVTADIVRSHEEITHYQKQLENASLDKHDQIQEQIQKLLVQLQDYVDELTDIGCELKDFRLGLVDFIGHHADRDIYLCWKHGEETIEYWHELNTGFSGRQPISLLHEKD